MAADQALQLLTQLLWTSFLVAAPLLIATLVVGVLVGIVQVVTQLQEMSLSYVPKLVVAFFVLLVFGPWMLNRLITFSTSLYSGIAVIR
jgi:flagellar biosynthetic protein FliQ